MKNNYQKPFKNLYNREFTALESMYLIALTIVSLLFYFLFKTI